MFSIKGYTENKSFEDFQPKLKIGKKKLIFLTESEISQIKNVEIPESKLYLNRVRDVLLFLCYTGLRHSDVYKLKKSDIKKAKIILIITPTVSFLPASKSVLI